MALLLQFGVVFTLLTQGMVLLNRKFAGGKNNSEDFNSESHL